VKAKKKTRRREERRVKGRKRVQTRLDMCKKKEPIH